MRTLIIIVIIFMALSNFSSWVSIGVNSFQETGTVPIQEIVDGLFGGGNKVLPEKVSTEGNDDIVNSFLPKVKEAFKAGEEKYLKDKPDEPDDGTNPDAKKCICKGTGRIVQGDGHVTSCPYHGNSRIMGLESAVQELKVETATEAAESALKAEQAAQEAANSAKEAKESAQIVLTALASEDLKKKLNHNVHAVQTVCAKTISVNAKPLMNV